MSQNLDKCFSSAKINSLELRNRIIKAATFEGMSANGVPKPSLGAFHSRLAEGGIGMTTLAYCGAESNGRVMDSMLYMDEQIKPQLQQIISDVQSHGAKVSGQLSHCGHFSKNKDFKGRRPLGPSFGINSVGIASGMPFAGALTIPEIKERVKTFARAALFMKNTGFDAIEIHFGHGYGISQFISPRTNKRKDEYGGSLENRMRFALEVLAAVRAAVGDDFPILGKISMMDGVSDGIKIEDAVEIAKMLDKGGIDGIITSGGTSSMNPMLMFRGDTLLNGMIEQETNPIMKFGLKLVGPKLFRQYPYEDTYFLPQAQRIRDAVECAVVYIGGCSSNADIERVMGAGFDFIQLGRSLIHDPDFVKHAMADANYKNGCSHCNKCATLIEHPDGIRCVEVA